MDSNGILIFIERRKDVINGNVGNINKTNNKNL